MSRNMLGWCTKHSKRFFKLEINWKWIFNILFSSIMPQKNSLLEKTRSQISFNSETIQTKNQTIILSLGTLLFIEWIDVKQTVFIEHDQLKKLYFWIRCWIYFWSGVTINNGAIRFGLVRFFSTEWMVRHDCAT